MAEKSVTAAFCRDCTPGAKELVASYKARIVKLERENAIRYEQGWKAGRESSIQAIRELEEERDEMVDTYDSLQHSLEQTVRERDAKLATVTQLLREARPYTVGYDIYRQIVEELEKS